MTQRILVVEDDALTSSMIRLNLAHEGFDVVVETAGETALARLDSEHFDLLVLDYMLPGLDGQDVLQVVRQRGIGTPVLMVTARSETPLKVKALERGADDYLTKPFDVDELVARAKALIRRSQAAQELPSDRRARMGRVEVDFVRMKATDVATGEVHDLSEKEAGLLETFAREPGTVLTRADLIEEVWGMDANPTERTVDNFIVRLRRLVEPDPSEPRHVVSVRGRGYRYEE